MTKKFKSTIISFLLVFTLFNTSINFVKALPKGKCIKINTTNAYFLSDSDAYVAQVDASKWKNENTMFEDLGVAFKFNQCDWNSTYWNWNFFMDWIRELDWLKEKKINFYICNLTKFNCIYGVDILDLFANYVIPYWNENTSENSKQFNFYYT